MPLAMTRAEGRATVERWLSEARVATDSLQLTLPPSSLGLGAGDVIALAEAGGSGHFRIDRVEQMGTAQSIEAVRIEPESYRPVDITEEPPATRPFISPVPVFPLFLDIPLMTGAEVPHAPHIALGGTPWPGSAAIYASDADANYRLNSVIDIRSRIGITQTPLLAAAPGLFDRGEGLTVSMLHGQLESISTDDLLAGGNLCAIGDGTPDGWEIMQFRDAELVDQDTYFLHTRLRGQLGTDALMPAEWPSGSYIVMLDGIPEQIQLADAQRRRARHYRIGPTGRPVDDPSYQHAVIAFEGVGLRPFAPVHLTARDTGGGITLSWVRRTRIDGDRWETPDVPLGEERELYLVQVSQNGSVLREQIVEAPNWTYSAANRASDGLTGGITLAVAQISGLFGPGAFASLEITA